MDPLGAGAMRWGCRKPLTRCSRRCSVENPAQSVTRIENNVADRSRTNPVGWGVLRLQHSALPSGTARSGFASTMAPSSRANPVIRISDLNPATRFDPSPVAQMTCRPMSSSGL